jgi:hypothetical protein
MRAKLMLLWLPFVLVAVLSLPGAVFAFGYSYDILVNRCGKTPHTAVLNFSATWDEGSPADEIVWAVYGQKRYGGDWHTMWVDANYENIPEGSATRTWVVEHRIHADAHRVRLMWGVNFKQSGRIAWEASGVSRVC